MTTDRVASDPGVTAYQHRQYHRHYHRRRTAYLPTDELTRAMGFLALFALLGLLAVALVSAPPYEPSRSGPIIILREAAFR